MTIHRPSRNLYFTGFMASGKSRIGEETARSLGWRFIDTDRYIEEKTGKSISEIFAQEGEKQFRALELETIKELSHLEHHVISLGGGTLTQPAIVEIVKSTGTLIRLNASVETLSERIGRKNTRPLMAGLNEEERKEKIRSMLADREKYYALADFSVESSEESSIDQTVIEVRNKAVAWEYKRVEVNTPSGRYPIFISPNSLDLTARIIDSLNLSRYDVMIVTDSNVAKAQAHNIRKLKNSVGRSELFVFPAGERQKNLETLNTLYSALLKKNFSRKTLLLQFSGGVVGDMAGFAAATYQRGIPFIQIPTTLLSMVDSSVGGKVAVNHPLGKNMIGAFYQPRAVMINLETLHTLPPPEYLAGMAEVIKYGVIRDPELFDVLEKNVSQLLNRDGELLAYVIERCCSIKAQVVGEDEKEEGIRAILNYGHTFGHAIEKVTEYEGFSHGVAISLGMRVAGRLATLLKLWQPEDEKRQKLLLDAYGFPKRFMIDKKEAWAAMGVDKKAERGKRVFILPERIGSVIKVTAPHHALVDKAWSVLEERE